MNTDNMIFVFGSNLRGVHGAGAARYALDHKGASMGRPEGIQGMSYAIPTKDKAIRRLLPLNEIQEYVDRFIWFANANPDKQFQVTQIGCGLAGGKAEDIAPMFFNAPKNCFFDRAWAEYLPNREYWGTI